MFCALLVLVCGCWFVLVVWLIVLVSCYVLYFMLWWFGVYFYFELWVYGYVVELLCSLVVCLWLLCVVCMLLFSVVCVVGWWCNLVGYVV